MLLITCTKTEIAFNSQAEGLIRLFLAVLALRAHLAVFLVFNVLISSYGLAISLGLQTHALLSFEGKWSLHCELPIALLGILNGCGYSICQDPGDRRLWFDLLAKMQG